MVQEYRPAWLLTLVTLDRVSTEDDSLEEAQLGRDSGPGVTKGPLPCREETTYIEA